MKIKNPFWILFLLLTLDFVPTKFAEAKGGFFGGPIFSILLTVAIVVLTAAAASPLALAAQGLDAVTGGTVITAAADSATGFAVMDGGIGASSFLADGLGLGSSFLGSGLTVGAVMGGVTAAGALTTASMCLSGSNNFEYSGCGGNSGSSNNSQAQQAAIQANTVTKQAQGGLTYTCPDGYNLDPDTNQCIADGYISCASAGHPELVCPSNTSCTANGQCQGSTVSGGSCNADSGSACSSAANSCGMTNQATYECNGSCPATTPSDSSCVAPTISISEEPSLVNPGNQCAVTWTVQNATSCTLSSNGQDSSLPESAAIPTGSYNSPALNAATTYTLSCKNGTVVSSQLSVTCHINPQFNEI